jgi:HEAT repeat protein
LDEARVLALVEDLSNPDENVRLKATNALVNAQPPVPPVVIEKLQEVLHTDANPAVKFLARKALSNLGESVEEGEQKKSSETLPASEKPGIYQVLKDGRALHKVALSTLDAEIKALLSLFFTRDEGLQRRLSRAVLQLGSEVVAGPLIQAHLGAETLVVSQGEISAPDATEVLLGGDIDQAVHAAKLRQSRIDPAIAAAMGNIEVPEVFEVLVDMLEADAPVLAYGGLSILSDLNDHKVLLPLLGAMGRGDEEFETLLQEHLLRVIGEDAAWKCEALEVLATYLTTVHPLKQQLAAVNTLGRLADPSSLDTLRQTLSAGEPELRAEAVWALARYDFPASWLVSNIRPLLQDDDSDVVASAAVALLGGDGGDHAEAAAEELLKGATENRLALAKALEMATSPLASGFLESLLRDSELVVREAAVLATRKIQDPAIVDFLGGMLADDDEQVALAAIETVGRLKMEEYNDLLALLIDQAESPKVQATMLMCLGHMGIVENVPTVAYYLGAEDARIRANAVEALEHLRDPKSTSLVHLSLNDPVPRVVSNACKALWGWGELRVHRRLGELLQGDLLEQRAACHALGEIIENSRVEARLVDSPLLVTALRQGPRYQEIRRIVGG